MVASLLQYGQPVDQALAPLGLKGQSYMIFGRQYHGLVQGRPVDITFVRGRWGWTAISIYVKANLNTRLAIGKKRPLLDCRDCARLILSDPDLNQLEIFAQDEGWAYNLLADSKVKAVVSRLMTGQKSPGHIEIYLQPDRVWLYAHSPKIAEAPLKQWVEDLLALAEAAAPP